MLNEKRCDSLLKNDERVGGIEPIYPEITKSSNNALILELTAKTKEVLVFLLVQV